MKEISEITEILLNTAVFHLAGIPQVEAARGRKSAGGPLRHRGQP